MRHQKADRFADTGQPRVGQKRPGRRQSRELGIGLVGVLALLGGVLVLLIVVGLLLPTLLSTGFGKRVVMGYLNSTIAGSLDADRIRLAWFSGQSAAGVTLADPQGNLVASIRQLEAPDVRLMPFLLGSPHYGRIMVDAEAILVQQEPGQPTNIQQAIEPTQPREDDPEQGIDEDLSLQLEFTADRVTYGSPGVEQVELTDVDLGLDIPDIRNIAARLRSNLVHEGQPGRIDMSLSINDAFDADGQPQVGQANVQAQGQLTNFPLPMLDRLMDQEGRLALLLGDEINATFTAAGPITALEADVQAQSPHMTTNMQLVGDDQAIRATEGSRLQLQITPEAFAAWMAEPAPGEASQLVQPFTLNVQLNELILPREAETGMDLMNAAVNLQATSEDIVLDVPGTGRMTLGQPRASVQSPALGQQLTANLQAQATVGDVSEPVSAQLAVRNLLDDQQPLAATLEATQLPLALADVLVEQDGLLVQTLGETLSTTVNIQQTPAGDITFAGQVQAPRLVGPFEGAYGADGAISLRTPQPMTLLLSPQALARLMAGDADEPARIVFDQDAELAINIEQLDIAMLDDLQAPAEAETPPAAADGQAQPQADQPMRLDPERTRISMTVTSPQLVGRDLTANEPFRIENARLAVRGQDLRQLLEIDLEATIQQLRQQAAPQQQQPQPQPPGGASLLQQMLRQRIGQPADQPAQTSPQQQPQPQPVPDGRLTSSTRIHGLLSDTGEIQPATATIQSQTQLVNAPSALLDALGQQEGTLTAVLGPRTSAEVALDYRGAQGGNVDLHLQSTNAQATVPGRITPDRVLHLRSPATATLNVTPQMGQQVLSTINPFLNAVSGERPITLTIQDQGFALPLDDFDLTNAQANAELHLGTLHLQQGGVSQLLFGALAAVDRRFAVGQAYDAQFTPATIQLTNGTLRYDDLFMQVAGIQLGFRGSVNYPNERFNLAVALPATSLARLIPNVERAVGPNYQLSIPLTGTFDNPQLDTAAMTRELTQLAFQAGLREAVGDDRNGVGGLLDIITGRPRQQQQQDEQQEPAEQGEPEQTEPQPRDPVRDIFDLFRPRPNQNQDQNS